MAYNTDKTIDIMEQVFTTMPQLLDERQRRLLAASIAKGYGHGGITVVSSISGMDVRTIRSGIHEINNGVEPVTDNGKLRKSGQAEKQSRSWNLRFSQILKLLLKITPLAIRKK